MRRLLAALVVVAACSGNGGDGPEDALENQLEMLSDGQHGPLYDLLHPAQREVIDRDDFIRCQPPVNITDVDVTDSYEETITIPGTDLEVEWVALTVDLQGSGLLGEASDTRTFHEIAVDNKWTWITDPDLFDC